MIITGRLRDSTPARGAGFVDSPPSASPLDRRSASCATLAGCPPHWKRRRPRAGGRLAQPAPTRKPGHEARVPTGATGGANWDLGVGTESVTRSPDASGSDGAYMGERSRGPHFESDGCAEIAEGVGPMIKLVYTVRHGDGTRARSPRVIGASTTLCSSTVPLRLLRFAAACCQSETPLSADRWSADREQSLDLDLRAVARSGLVPQPRRSA